MKYVALFVVFMYSLAINAQTRGLVIGESIEFFPVNSALKAQCGGYDCFYDTNKSYKNHKFNEKEKNRFAADDNKLTPFSEIEGHSFHVEQTQKYSKDGKAKNESYIAFLTRDDGAKLILRVPFQPSEKSNDITKGMVISFYDEKGDITRGVCIPFIQPDTIRQMRKLIGKELVRNSKGKYYLGDSYDYRSKGKLTTGYVLKIILENAQMLSENKDNIGGVFYNGVRIVVEDIVYKNVPRYSFAQLFAKVKYNGSTVYLPLLDYYGNGPSTLLTNYRLVDCFEDYAPLLEKFKEGLPPVTKDLVPNLEVFYGRRKMFKKGDEKVHYVSSDSKNYPYRLSEGTYKIEKIDFDVTIRNLELSVYMKDSLNMRFVVPAKAPQNKDSEEYANTFYDAFYLKSDIIILDSLKKEKEKAWLAVEKAMKEFEESEISSIAKRYGAKMGIYYRKLSASDRNTFRKAAAKWGAATAKDIVEGYVRIGWNKAKCRMSWGEPRDINTTIGIWGRHEQWCYDSSYLYFENGILTSIQD